MPLVKVSSPQSVSFIIPTYNSGRFLDECLRRIKNQDYPPDLVEVLIVDGGSTDETVEIAQKHHCKIIKNDKRLTGPGYAIGFEKATSKINIFFADDNWLPHVEWLKSIVRPFMKDPDIVGAFGPFIVDRHHGSLNRYFSWIESTPYHYFMCQNEASKKLYEKSYGILEDEIGYKVLGMTVEKFPILGLGNGFALNRRKVELDPNLVKLIMKSLAEKLDDILPVIKMIESGYKIAYVPAGGIIHYHLQNYRQFLQKYTWKTRNNVLLNLAYFNARWYLSSKRRLREKMWPLYALTVVGPLKDAALGIARHHDIAYLHHPLTCLLLAIITGLTMLAHPKSALRFMLALK